VTVTVIKIGGRAQGDPALATALADRWHAHPGTLCLVHGGGDEMSALQRSQGVEPQFVGGRRLTSAADIDRLRMTLSGLANKRLVSALVAVGVDAVGLSGEDAALLVADVAEQGALGAVGTVRAVRTPLLKYLLRGGFLPVVSPLARANGATPALNVNGDDAAAAIAIALGADGLLFVSDVPAVRVQGMAVTRLDHTDAAGAIASGDIADGMAAKVRAGLSAVASGVPRVWIGDVGLLGETPIGTRLVASTVTAGTGAHT
jgi:acetylglutamate kinase